jgi:hypothetical protein
MKRKISSPLFSIIIGALFIIGGVMRIGIAKDVLVAGVFVLIGAGLIVWEVFDLESLTRKAKPPKKDYSNQKREVEETLEQQREAMREEYKNIYNPEAVIQAIRENFPREDPEHILAMLNEYGRESHHRERDRVQIGILILSEGDLKKLRANIDLACLDYRDVLMAAYYSPPDKKR